MVSWRGYKKGESDIPTNHSGKSPARKIWLLLVCILILSGAVRFYRLSSIGLQFPDSFIYTASAYRWSLGEFENKWGKPGYHLLGAAAFKILGRHDYCLPYLNAFCDVLNILLIFLISRRLGMKTATIFSAVILYGFMPMMIVLSRTGLVHTLSMTFAMFAFLAFLNYLQNDKKMLPLILTGLALSYAGNLHPTLLTLPLFFGILIIVHHLKRPFRLRDFVTPAVHGGILVVSFAAVFVGFALLIKTAPGTSSGLVDVLWHDLLGRLFLQRQYGTGGAGGAFIRKLAHSFVVIVRDTTFPIFALVCVTLATGAAHLGSGVFSRIMGRSEWRATEKEWNLILVWIFVFYFMVATSAGAKAFVYRLMFPMVPFVLIGTVFLLETLLETVRISYASAILSAVSLVLVVLNWTTENIFSQEREVYYRMFTPAFARRTADVLHDRLDAQNRLLITPSTVFKVSDRFSLYLADNFHCIPRKPPVEDPGQMDVLCNEQVGGIWIDEKYEYLQMDWDPLTFPSRLREAKIRYVLVCKDMRTIGRRALWTAGPDYSLEEEYRKLSKALGNVGARLMHASEGLLVFEIPRASSKSLLSENAPGGFHKEFVFPALAGRGKDPAKSCILQNEGSNLPAIYRDMVRRFDQIIRSSIKKTHGELETAEDIERMFFSYHIVGKDNPFYIYDSTRIFMNAKNRTLVYRDKVFRERGNRMLVYAEAVNRHDKMMEGKVRIECGSLEEMEETFLSYHVYDEGGDLVEWDGIRFPLFYTSAGVCANYEIPLRRYLEKAPGSKLLRIEFDLVRGREWHSQKHPEFEMANVEVALLSVDIRLWYAFLPRVVAANSRMVIPSLFRIKTPTPELVFFQPSMESFPLDGRFTTRYESSRGRFPIIEKEAETAAAMVPYTTPSVGFHLVKLGFVHEGVTWYSKIGWSSPVRICVALPIWVLCIIGSAATVFLLHSARLLKRPGLSRWKIPAFFAALLMAYYFALPLAFTLVGPLFIVPAGFVYIKAARKDL